MQFRNRSSFFASIWSFNDVLLRAINDVSRFFLTRSIFGAVIKTFHINACVRLLFKCRDGSDILLMSECSSHWISILCRYFVSFHQYNFLYMCTLLRILRKLGGGSYSLNETDFSSFWWSILFWFHINH